MFDSFSQLATNVSSINVTPNTIIANAFDIKAGGVVFAIDLAAKTMRLKDTSLDYSGATKGLIPYPDKNYMITNIEFDKSYMSLSDIMNKVILSTDDNSNNINVIDDNSYIIDGKGGDDIITANSGNDIIIGGSGNDTLTGGLGSDTYKFDDNFGNDTIINYNPTLKDIDTIEFTSKNITKESLNFSKDKNDLLIVKDELNSIRVKDYFLLNYNKEPVNAINTKIC